MSIARLWLTLLYIGVNVPAEHHRTLGGEFLVTAGELAGLHIVFEHAHAGFGVIEPGTGDFVEEHHLLEPDDPQLARGLVVKERRRSGFPTRDHERAVGRVAERVGLARLTGT